MQIAACSLVAFKSESGIKWIRASLGLDDRDGGRAIYASRNTELVFRL